MVSFLQFLNGNNRAGLLETVFKLQAKNRGQMSMISLLRRSMDSLTVFFLHCRTLFNNDVILSKKILPIERRTIDCSKILGFDLKCCHKLIKLIRNR